MITLSLAVGACGGDDGALAAADAATCTPGETVCRFDAIYRCFDGPNGRFEYLAGCRPDETCLDGTCRRTARDAHAAADDASIPRDVTARDPGPRDVPAPDAPETTRSADPGVEDPGPQDPGTVDPGSTDPGTVDPGPPDPGTVDAGAADPGAIDVAPPDDGARDAEDLSDISGDTPAADLATDDAAPPPDEGVVDTPHAPGPFAFRKVVQTAIVGDLLDVRWLPDGAHALILAESGRVVRYRAADDSLDVVATLDARLAAVDVTPDGDLAIVCGTDGDGQGRIWTAPWPPAGDAAVFTPAGSTVGDAVSLSRHPADLRWVVGARTSWSTSAAHLWDPSDGVTATGGLSASGGLTDAVWATVPSLWGPDPVVLTLHGFSGAASRTWLPTTGAVVDNGWSRSFGNPGAAAWRPGGRYAVAVGTSTNILYVFDGAWTSHRLPDVRSASHAIDIAWRDDGSRAILVGNVAGPGVNARIFDLRPGAATAPFDPAGLRDNSIVDWDAAPWHASTRAYLNAADWRPASPCHEGLIVGADAGQVFSPTFGTLLRFQDPSDPDCAR